MENLQVGFRCVCNLVLRRVFVGLSDSISWASVASFCVCGIAIFTSSIWALSVSIPCCFGTKDLAIVSPSLVDAIPLASLVLCSEICCPSSFCAESAKGVLCVWSWIVGVSGEGKPCQSTGTRFFVGVCGSCTKVGSRKGLLSGVAVSSSAVWSVQSPPTANTFGRCDRATVFRWCCLSLSNAANPDAWVLMRCW